MPAFVHLVMAKIRAFLRADDLDREFQEELEAHLAMAEEDKVRQGMTREEARRAARIELGGLTQLREAGREARGLPWLDTFWLDIKLGLRMLRKSWGLTLIGGLAMTLAIFLGVLIFLFFDLSLGGRLPLEEGDRVVAIQAWDGKEQQRRETAMQDFERWRDGLRSVREVSAFQTVERNMVLDGSDAADDAAAGPIVPVRVAEMSASGFRLARIAPLMGRHLIAEDELTGALPVVVIGFGVWQSHFSADPAVVGRTLRLDGKVHTVVGVMPEDFAFPVNHRFWTPLPREQTEPIPAAPEASVFARLAPGVTLRGAQAELATLGLLPPLTPQPGEELDVRVVPYTFAFTGDFKRGELRWLVRILLLFVALLLVPPCANIAILVYARTITRQEEFAARYSLGASRGRIVGQLFLEMLVLAGVAAGVASVLAHFAIGWMGGNLVDEGEGGAPFWMDFTLSLRGVLFALALAAFGAMIAGFLPALKATGRQMRTGLHGLGNRTGVQLGATWTALVVVQVALCLAVLPLVAELTWGTIRNGVLGPGFAAEEYLTARIEMDRKGPAHGEAVGEPGAGVSRYTALRAELARQLRAEPGILGVTVASLPGDAPWQRVEVGGSPLPDTGIPSSQDLVRVNQVDDAFLEVFDVPLLSGRPFEAGDFDAGRRVVIVNRTFVQRLVGAGNPLGRRVRYLRRADEATAAAQEPWYEIVGVVEDRPANVDRGTMYRPLTAGQMPPASLSLRLGSDAVSVADRLREITLDLDPTLRVTEIRTLDAVYQEKQVGNNLGASSLVAVTLSVLLLSAAGMYALMSFTVNQRRREIGIRSALGAQPRSLLAGIFRRAAGQLGVGALAGIVVASLLDHYLPAEVFGGWRVPGVIPAAAVFMLMMGLLATAGPARRGLRVDPIEELRQG